MKKKRKNLWTTVGGITNIAGYVVSVAFNPVLGGAIQAAGTAVIGLAAKDNEEATAVARNFFSAPPPEEEGQFDPLPTPDLFTKIEREEKKRGDKP